MGATTSGPRGCCLCLKPTPKYNLPPVIYPVGYGLGCCGFPAGCCGYGEGLGPGGPFSCGGDCCGTSGIIFGNADCFDYFCCGCCGITENRCCGCGSGIGQAGCGGNGYCGGGCCCCCYDDYPLRGSRQVVPEYLPQSLPTSVGIIQPPLIVPQRMPTPMTIQSQPAQSILLSRPITPTRIIPIAQPYPFVNQNRPINAIPQVVQNQPTTFIQNSTNGFRMNNNLYPF